MPRAISHCYRDPLSELWLAAAYRIGLRVERCEHAFAHSDGKGTIFIASDEHLDPDDCLAQMIFHELCHSLIEGPESFAIEDWGLDNRSSDDDEREHATLRLQAVLTDRFGLRSFLAPTTDFRDFYDALGQSPLAPRALRSVQLAIQGLRRSQTNPWWPHLGKALAATASILDVAAQWSAPGATPSLYRLHRKPQPAHPSELPAGAPATRCGLCAWRNEDGFCLQADLLVDGQLPGCERYEPPFDCQDCGACCREAYHSVTITEGDAIAERHPALLVHRESYIELARTEGHCIALENRAGRYACTVYDDRPTCCREFENAGEHCLTARRRVGLSL